MRRFWPLFALCPASLAGCLELRETAVESSEVERCASCHGDPEREGDYLLRAAPPRDL